MSSFLQIYNSLPVQIVTGLFSSIFFMEVTVAGSGSDPYAKQLWTWVLKININK